MWFPAPDRATAGATRTPAVLLLETRLQELRYDPGTVDGRFDETTAYALHAFQEVNGLTVDGLACPGVFAALVNPRAPAVLVPGGHPSRVEVDWGPSSSRCAATGPLPRSRTSPRGTTSGSAAAAGAGGS